MEIRVGSALNNRKVSVENIDCDRPFDGNWGESGHASKNGILSGRESQRSWFIYRIDKKMADYI